MGEMPSRCSLISNRVIPGFMRHCNGHADIVKMNNHGRLLDIIVLCFLCDIREKTCTDWAVQRMKIRKELLSVNVSVSWLLRRLGGVHLVNLEKLLAIEMCGHVKGTYSVGLAPCVPVVAGLRHDVGNVHVVDEIVGALKHRPDKSGG